jgi:hypothetical protein
MAMLMWWQGLPQHDQHADAKNLAVTLAQHAVTLAPHVYPSLSPEALQKIAPCQVGLQALANATVTVAIVAGCPPLTTVQCTPPTTLTTVQCTPPTAAPQLVLSQQHCQRIMRIMQPEVQLEGLNPDLRA